MPHDSDGLSWHDLQVEVRQHRLSIIVAEKHLFELNRALQVADGLLVFLMHARLGVDEGEDTLTGGQAKLELAPEGRDAGDGVPQDANALQEEEPVTRRDVA